MKNLLHITLLFLVQVLYSQATSGSIIYGIKPISFEIKEGVDVATRNMLEKSQAAAEKQTFILEFNRSRSKFVMNDASLKDASSEEAKFFNMIGAIRFTADYSYFLDQKENFELFKQNDGTIIKKDFYKINWEITAESKTIDGYLCYKAVYNKEYMGRDNKTKINRIVAWFAPSLPYGFGPKEYNGTPGLILELQEFDTIYYASSITILKDKELVIEFPKGKTVSQEDYTKKVMSN